MEQHEYETMYHVEGRYWWYVGLHRLVLKVLAQHVPVDRPAKILDAGCGTGGFLHQLSERPGHVVGIDLSSEAVNWCRVRGFAGLTQASICEIPFQSHTFDAITSLDVAYCLDPDDVFASFGEMYRVLKPGGVLILNLPAYNFLRSTHDIAIHTRHRFRLSELRSMLEGKGFAIVVGTYRNTVLFPAAAAVRILKRLLPSGNAEIRSDVQPLPGPINSALTSILIAENALIQRGLRLPFGLSIFCVARKPA
ncbi:MAG: class I SAM-dependent methyltransferase [Thermodesulfobacteriota bacterium]